MDERAAANDEVITPSTTINPADNSFENPALAADARRR